MVVLEQRVVGRDFEQRLVDEVEVLVQELEEDLVGDAGVEADAVEVLSEDLQLIQFGAVADEGVEQRVQGFFCDEGELPETLSVDMPLLTTKKRPLDLSSENRLLSTLINSRSMFFLYCLKATWTGCGFHIDT